MHRVLVTSVGGNIGQGVVKSLRAGSRKYYIVGIDKEPLSAGFCFSDASYTVPRVTDSAFPEQLLRIIQKEKIEAVYVCSPQELEFYSSQKVALESAGDTLIFVNPQEVVRIGQDKLLTIDFLREYGYPYLESVAVTDRKGVSDLIQKIGFPLLVKPRKGYTSRNVFVVNSSQELEAISSIVPDLIVQRYLPDHDNEYTASVLSGPDKKVRASIILHRYINLGTTYRTELVQDESLTLQVLGICERLGVIGVCNVQFKVVDGKAFVFEINPRFSGTSGIRYLYGFNDSEMIFELFRLKQEISQPDLHPLVVLRYWNETVIRDVSFGDIRKHYEERNER